MCVSMRRWFRQPIFYQRDVRGASCQVRCPEDKEIIIIDRQKSSVLSVAPLGLFQAQERMLYFKIMIRIMRKFMVP